MTNDQIPRATVGAWLQAKANKLDVNGLEPNGTAEVVHELAAIVFNGLDLVVEGERMEREANELEAAWHRREAVEADAAWSHTAGVNP